MNMRIVTVCLLLALASPTLAATPEGNPVEGKRLYMTVGCYQCHGTTGSGGLAGPRLAPNPLSLEGIRAKLRTPSGRMPVYTAKVISDAEIADVLAYLQSIPAGKPAREIPLLNH